MPTTTTTSETHLKHFSRIVQDLRTEWSEQRQITNDKTAKKFAEIDKILNVLSKISDSSAFEASPTALSDLHFIFSVLVASRDIKNAALWNTIGLLTKLCGKNSLIRRFYREKLKLLPILTDLLTGLPITSKERGVKVLDLMRHVAFGVKIYREEEFLLRLLPKLIEYVNSSEMVEKCHSLFILVCLIRRNYIVGKTLISFLSVKERNRFLTEEGEGDKIQILIDQLNFLLNELSLSSAHFDESRLSKVCDAFCAAYAEEDWPQMELLAVFLDDICAKTKKAQDDATIFSLMQQVLLVVDYSDDTSSGVANEITFKFFRTLFRLSLEPPTFVDLIVRSLLAQLETPAHALQAVSLLRDFTFKVTDMLSSIDSTQLQNIRLQLEPVISALASHVFSPFSSRESEKTLAVREVMLETLCIVSDVGNWSNMVTAKVKGAKVKAIVDELVECGGSTTQRLLPSYALLATFLQSDLVNRKEVEAVLVERLRGGNCTGSEAKKILIVLKGGHQLSTDEVFNDDENDTIDEDGVKEIASEDPSKTEDAVQALMETVKADLAKQNVNSDLSEILELGDFRLNVQRRQLDSMKTSLRMADDKIGQLSEHNLLLENEISRMSALMRSLCMKAQSAEKELSYVKEQHFAQQDEATQFKKRLTQICNEREEENATLMAENEKVVMKARRYKENNEELQAAIKHQMAENEELQTRLKGEMKEKSEMVSALEKREERLKKKERILEDETKQREKLQGELEAARKEFTLLQSLTKRQEQALAKKEKQIQEVTEERDAMKKVQEQIFNLSKMRQNS